MKKRVCMAALLLLSLFILPACAKGEAQPKEINGFFITEGVALTGEMKELGQSKEYVALMSSAGTLTGVIDTMTSQEYATPEDVYLVKLTDDALSKAMGALSGKDKIDSNLMEILRSKINGAVFANMLNANSGSETVAAASMLSWGKSYIQPKDWAENTLLLLKYPGEFSSIVSFNQSGEGVISASSMFVKNGDTDIAAAVGDYLGMEGSALEHHSGSELQGYLTK